MVCCAVVSGEQAMARVVSFFVIFGLVAGCGSSDRNPMPDMGGGGGGTGGDGGGQAPEKCDEGNQTRGEGCEVDCTMPPPPNGGPKITMCAHASDPPLASGTCQVTAGGAARLFTGTVLTP